MATVMGAGSPDWQSRSNSTARSNFGRPRGKVGHSGSVNNDGHAGYPGSGRAHGAVPLDNLIQEQIIPRLLMAHSHWATRQVSDGPHSITAEEAARFASLPLELEADELLTLVEGYLARGVCVESVYLDLLAPSARKLGQYWEEDRCDFVDVTMGLWRLQEVMREIAIGYPSSLSPIDPPRSALFLPMLGDCHSFGALMVEEVFSRGGWQTDVLLEPKRKELLQIVADRHFDLIGLTITAYCPTGNITEIISAVRSVSRSPKTLIFIGGRMVEDNPGMVSAVGADGTARDARSFLALAEVQITGSSCLDLSVA